MAHRVVADGQPLGDRLVGEPLAHEIHDVALACGERRDARTVGVVAAAGTLQVEVRRAWQYDGEDEGTLHIELAAGNETLNVNLKAARNPRMFEFIAVFTLKPSVWQLGCSPEFGTRASHAGIVLVVTM